MESQVEKAINIASDPSVDRVLQEQAFEYINNIRTNPSSSWHVCLNLFTRAPPPSEVVRHVSLEIVNTAIEARLLDRSSLQLVQNTLMDYVRQRFVPGSRQQEVDSPTIQNKFTQTLTYLFTSLYSSGWESFFDDFRGLAGEQATIGTVNVAGTILYLRILGSVHDEIADPLVARTAEELKRNTELKDLIRQRDMQKIAQSWQEILAKWTDIEFNVVEMCLKVISRWVSWIDINLVVNESLLSNLFAIAGQQSMDESRNRVRDAAIDTFTEIVSKKMKPGDKLELISFLNLGQVVGQLIASPALSELQHTPDYDTELAETVAKLVNTTMIDLVKILDSETSQDIRQRAEQQTGLFVPHLLRFFSDEYDEICSTVIPSLTEILTYFRKLAKSQGKLPEHYSPMVKPALDAIIMKMKYDETASWGEEDDQTDEAEFQELRKKLYVLQQTVAAIDEELYTNTLSQVVGTTFSRLQTSNGSLSWRDLDLALHEMYLFGELAVRNSGLYQKREPSSAAAQRLIEMMLSMVESDIASYPHPAIQLQYMEICVRYTQFFEQNTQYIPKVLENFVRLTHSNHTRVKGRSWYLFVRFVRPLRHHISPFAKMVVQAIGDLLTIRAELPEDSSEDMSSDEEDQSADALFTSQLYLFEAIGCIASGSNIPVEDKVLFADSVLNPLLVDIQQNLPTAKAQDERSILQIHHIIQAIGTLARGFSDWSGGSSDPPSDSGVTAQFARASEAILVALESLDASLNIRTASRFAFSRLIGVLGRHLLDHLPRWINGLLSQSSSRDEMALFLRALDQVVYSFKADISGILDELLTPLLQRVFNALAEPTSGTDDEIQLAELRREYLAFVLIILNNELGSVLVSSSNQPTFENIISTAEMFARDTKDYMSGRNAIHLLIRMLQVWGGPDVAIPNVIPANANQVQVPTPALSGFDSFALSRFSPLCWSVPTSAGFNTKDAQAKQVLYEIALLQLELLKKCGPAYVERLKGELSTLGVNDEGVQEYINAMTQGEKSFKSSFAQFVTRLSSG